CDVLARATALLIAIHLDPLGLAGRLDPPGNSPRAPASAPSAPAGVIPTPPAPLVDLPEMPGSSAAPASDLSPETGVPPPGATPPRDLSPETGVPPPGATPPRDLSPETGVLPAPPVAAVVDALAPAGSAAGSRRPVEDLSAQTGALVNRGDARP